MYSCRRCLNKPEVTITATNPPDHTGSRLVVYCSDERLFEVHQEALNAIPETAAFGIQVPGATAKFANDIHAEVLTQDAHTLYGAGAREIVLLDHLSCAGRRQLRGELDRQAEIRDIHDTQGIATKELENLGYRVIAALTIDWDASRGCWAVLDATSGSYTQIAQILKYL